jgi:hypothetical protein
MKPTGITPFLCGVMLTASISVLAADRSKPAAQAGTWKVATVDQGAIRSGTPGYDRDFPANNAKAANEEFTKQVKDLEEKGYEPFAATVYSGQSYNNERVYFFRKKD